MKETNRMVFLILGFIFDHFFGLEKGKCFCLAFVSLEVCVMASVIFCHMFRVKARIFYEYVSVQFHSSTQKGYLEYSIPLC